MFRTALRGVVERHGAHHGGNAAGAWQETLQRGAVQPRVHLLRRKRYGSLLLMPRQPVAGQQLNLVHGRSSQSCAPKHWGAGYLG